MSRTCSCDFETGECQAPLGCQVNAAADRMETALHQIDAWSRAYPLTVFPEPDFAKAAEVLKAAGMTLDAISASNMRHVVEGVGGIARGALNRKVAP